MSFIEKSLYSYDYDTADYGYWNTLDVDSFVDYFLFNEFTMNYDAGSYSTYLYKDLRGKLTIGPLLGLQQCVRQLRGHLVRQL